MIRDLLCDSDCVYQEKGLCEKQNDVVMRFGYMDGKEYDVLYVKCYVKCSDYMARKGGAQVE